MGAKSKGLKDITLQNEFFSLEHESVILHSPKETLNLFFDGNIPLEDREMDVDTVECWATAYILLVGEPTQALGTFQAEKMTVVVEHATFSLSTSELKGTADKRT